MRYLLLLLSFLSIHAFAQQKESTVSISCYVNPELYLQAGVVAYVSDKSGNISCKGKHIGIDNQSSNVFYYYIGSRRMSVKPRAKAVVPVGSAAVVSGHFPSILKLRVSYSRDASGNVSDKIKSIARMNAKTDRVKARESEGKVADQPEKEISKSTEEALAAVKKPQPRQPEPAPPIKTQKKEVPKSFPAKAKPKSTTRVAVTRSKTTVRKKPVRSKTAWINAVGLRVDFGAGATGFWPNFKHRFTPNHSLDAAILFFESETTVLSAQYEYNSLVQGARGLNWYAGIGPQFLFAKGSTAVGFVPVTGLDYKIPDSPINLAFDWRPTFYLSPKSDVEAGRFGLSFRVAF